jgi:hypothetical protein
MAFGIKDTRVAAMAASDLLRRGMSGLLRTMTELLRTMIGSRLRQNWKSRPRPLGIRF